MPRGRWKIKRERRNLFIKRALKTRAAMARIAQVAGRMPSTISQFNTKHGIRTIEESKIIQYSEQSRTKKAKRKKINFFPNEQKLKLLERHERALLKVARGWWKNRLIRKEFVTFENFLNSIKSYVSEQLDYYNPNAVTKTGRPKKVWHWMMEGAKIFCKSQHKTLEIAESKKATYSAESIKVAKRIQKRKLAQRLANIKVPTRFFLRKLGLDVNQVAIMGFEDIKRNLIRIIDAKKIGLTDIEKTIVKMNLEGIAIVEIGKKMPRFAGGIGIKRARVWQIIANAVKKLKPALKRFAAGKSKARNS